MSSNKGMAGSDLELDEIQQNELEALRAIYMDDFEQCDTKAAWNVCGNIFLFLLFFWLTLDKLTRKNPVLAFEYI